MRDGGIAIFIGSTFKLVTLEKEERIVVTFQAVHKKCNIYSLISSSEMITLHGDVEHNAVRMFAVTTLNCCCLLGVNCH